jgi:hypothetical protein
MKTAASAAATNATKRKRTSGTVAIMFRTQDLG